VFPVPYLQKFEANTTLQDISAANSSALGLPNVYYFGLSGNLTHSLAALNVAFYYVFSKGIFCLVAL
jgi:hypothetical protein